MGEVQVTLWRPRRRAVGVSQLLREAGFERQPTPPWQRYSRFKLPGERLSLYVNERSDDQYVSINKKVLDRPRYRNLRASVSCLLSPGHLNGDYDVTAEHVPKLIEEIKAMGEVQVHVTYFGGMYVDPGELLRSKAALKTIEKMNRILQKERHERQATLGAAPGVSQAPREQ